MASASAPAMSSIARQSGTRAGCASASPRTTSPSASHSTSTTSGVRARASLALSVARASRCACSLPNASRWTRLRGWTVSSSTIPRAWRWPCATPLLRARILCPSALGRRSMSRATTAAGGSSVTSSTPRIRRMAAGCRPSVCDSWTRTEATGIRPPWRPTIGERQSPRPTAQRPPPPRDSRLRRGPATVRAELPPAREAHRVLWRASKLG
mmetsp:Transcript_38376/g.110753  ORF Transcript_38376/g.110753 Transcript_38376/m.110753 type:complete len:211 (-) Transcript_38376:190-822(-)